MSSEHDSNGTHPDTFHIDDYLVVGALGSGGMGVVWEAIQESPVRRRVALKLVSAAAEDSVAESRFRAERQILASLQHPNIAQLFDAACVEQSERIEVGTQYYVMEVVDGRRLDKYCDLNNLDIRDRLKLFIQICNGVNHAHNAGIIHRDLKPSNVLVQKIDNHNVAKIIDFGLAKAPNTELDSNLTEGGSGLGTPHYMSPEQAWDASKVDIRSDVYSLGAILYELLSGSTPIEKTGSTTRLHAYKQLLDNDPPKPSQRLANSKQLTEICDNRRTDPQNLQRVLEGGLDSIVMRALERDPKDRYSSVNELSSDLARYLEAPAAASDKKTTEPKIPKAYAGSIAKIVAYVLIAALLAFGAQRLLSQESSPKLVDAAKALEAGDAKTARRILESIETEDRKTKWYELRQRIEGSAATLYGHGAFVIGLAVSPDGQLLASGGDDSTIRIWDLSTGKQIHKLRGHKHSVRYLDFSPDGRQIASASFDEKIKVWDVATSSEVATVDGHGSAFRCVKYSRDGKYLAGGSSDHTIKIWNTKDWHEVNRLDGHSGRVREISFNPDDTTLASASEDGTVRLWQQWSEPGQEESQVIESIDKQVLTVAFSPDGQTLALAGSSNNIELWNAELLKKQATLEGHKKDVHRLAFSPDGATLVSVSLDRSARLWNPKTTELKKSLMGHASYVYCCRFSPDGDLLYTGSADSTVKIWGLEGNLRQASAPITGQSESRIIYEEGMPRVIQVRFGPEYKKLYSLHDAKENARMVWSFETGERLREEWPKTLRDNYPKLGTKFENFAIYPSHDEILVVDESFEKPFFSSKRQ